MRQCKSKLARKLGFNGTASQTDIEGKAGHMYLVVTKVSWKCSILEIDLLQLTVLR